MSETEYLLLSRAGFTVREISQHKAKFCNLFGISPMLDSELKEHDRLRAEVSRLTAELEECNEARLEYQRAYEHLKANRDELKTELDGLRAQKPVARANEKGPWCDLALPEGYGSMDLYAHPVPAAQAVPDRDALIDLINEQIGDAYFCTRVWDAWHVGTMSDDDFEPVSESHATAELADAVIAMLSTAPQPPADQVPDARKTIDHFPDATKMVANHREEPLGHE